MAYAVLGPAGTFSEAAARRYWGDEVELTTVESLDVMGTMLAEHQVQGALIPLYNSITGWVKPALRLLSRHRLVIEGQIEMPVRQHLMAAKAGRLQDVEVVISHPLALEQCRCFISANLGGIPLQECSSTAEAARALMKDSRRAASIGSYQAACLYGLEVLQHDINSPGNITRFVHIATPTQSGSSRSGLRPGLRPIYSLEKGCSGHRKPNCCLSGVMTGS